jgi:GT2 family glycosyltransferase
VVDNGSTDGSMEKIKAWARGKIPVESKFFEYNPTSKPVHWVKYDRQTAEGGAISEEEARLESVASNRRMVLIQVRENLGFAGGNNVGLRYALATGADYFWLLNNDTVVSPNALGEMVSCAEENNGIIGAALHYYHVPDKIQAYGGGYFSQATGMVRTVTSTRPNHLDFINGASFLFSSQILQSVGYFDENIFLYFEENDYCIRARIKGYRCFPSNAVVYHKHGASSGNTDDSFAWRHVLKNKAYVLRKHFGYGFWLLFFIFGLVVSALGLASTPGKCSASRTVIAEWMGRLCCSVVKERDRNENRPDGYS